VASIPSYSDLFRIARDEIMARNARLSRESVEREGSDVNVLLAAMAAMGEEIAGQLADVLADSYLDSAEGAGLDRYVFDKYGLVRKPASASLGTALFTLSAVAPAGGSSIPAGTVLVTADGIQFLTTEALSIPAGSSSGSAGVRSVLSGADQNIKSATLTGILSSLTLLGGPTATVSNSGRTAGGLDSELDSSLRDRARRFWQTAQRGTRAAIEAAALAVVGVKTAVAFEALDSYGRPVRWLQVVVADGQTTAGAVSPALANVVRNTLEAWRPDGTFVSVVVADVVIQTVRLNLHYRAGADVDVTSERARAAITDYVNNLRPGEPFRRAAASLALLAVPGLVLLGDEVDSPSGDVIPQPTQVIRTKPHDLTICAVNTSNPSAALFSRLTILTPGQLGTLFGG